MSISQHDHDLEPGAAELPLEAIRDVALEAVHAGCAELIRGRTRLAQLRTRTKSPGDITTEIDRRSEAAIFSRLRAAYPGHAFLGEESGQTGTSRYRWIVDPLDGTVNYVHGIPYYAVAAAFEVDGVPVVGVIADPSRREYFTAIKGKGAFCNGRPIRVSSRTTLEEAVVGTVVPPPHWAGMPAYLAQFGAVARQAAGVRRAGAAALDLASVAAGRLDGFFVVSLKRWDIAAGALLVEEAGGRVADIDGSPDPLASNRLAAANQGLLPALLSLLSTQGKRT
jgi:myo-inositol-1(or 4)-monophosphatase